MRVKDTRLFKALYPTTLSLPPPFNFFFISNIFPIDPPPPYSKTRGAGGGPLGAQGIQFFFRIEPCLQGRGALPYGGGVPCAGNILHMKKKLKRGGVVIDRCDGASEHRRLILEYTPCTMSTPVTTPERASRPRVAPNAPRHEGQWREKSPGPPVPAFRLDVPVVTPVVTPPPALNGCEQCISPREGTSPRQPHAPRPRFSCEIVAPAAPTAAAVEPKKPAKTYTLPCRDCGAIWAEMCFCAKSDALWKAHLESNTKQSDASKP